MKCARSKSVTTAQYPALYPRPPPADLAGRAAGSTAPANGYPGARSRPAAGQTGCLPTTFPDELTDMTSYLDQLFSLRDRVAVITGGSSGIGRGIALALGQAGADVVLISRGEPQLRATASELEQAGCRAAWVSAGRGAGAAAGGPPAAAGDPFGPRDILVNCAGLTLRPPLAELTIEQWDELMAVNLTAPFLLGQQFGPPMAQNGWGRVIKGAA